MWSSLTVVQGCTQSMGMASGYRGEPGGTNLSLPLCSLIMDSYHLEGLNDLLLDLTDKSLVNTLGSFLPTPALSPPSCQGRSLPVLLTSDFAL